MTGQPGGIVIGPVRREELAIAETLLSANDLPLEGLVEHWTGFLGARVDEELVGLVGVEHYGDVGLLRSLVVRDDYRGRGLGDRLVRVLLSKCRQAGLRQLFLLTTTAEYYFPRFGFQAISREHVAPAVTESEEFRGACPQTAVAMSMELEPLHDKN